MKIGETSNIIFILVSNLHLCYKYKIISVSHCVYPVWFPRKL